VIKVNLAEEPDQNMDHLLGQYDRALWVEERHMNLMAEAIAKALGGE
jgi:ABC-type Zn2+ transport system substrate-binding protein/surface adhesin